MERKKRLRIQIGIIFLFIIGSLYFYFVNPVENTYGPQCFFKLLTGYNCPACGFQRAAHAFLHGHWMEAIAFNAFLLISLPYVLAFIIAEFFLSERLRRQWLYYLKHPYTLAAYLCAFVIWGIIRNLLHL